MKNIILFVGACLLALNVSAQVNVADLSGFDMTSIAGNYTNSDGDSAEVEVVPVDKNGKKVDFSKSGALSKVVEFEVNIEVNETAITLYANSEFSFDQYSFESVSEDGTVVFSQSEDCMDTQCTFGETKVTFTKGTDGRYSMASYNNYKAELNDPYGWDSTAEEPMDEPTDVTVDAFCKEKMGPTAIGEFTGDVICSVIYESTLIQQ